jgi:hypothetical protein
MKSFEWKEPPEDLPGYNDADWDLPPEFCTYEDEGCQLAPSCLNCPFPRCFEDKPLSRQKFAIERRDKEILRRYRRGKSIKALAIKFKVSTRTIMRVLGEGNSKSE